MIGRRRALRDGYAKLFAGVPGVTLLGADDVEANCWLTSIVVDPALAGWRAQDLGGHLAAQDIESRPIFKPMHLQPVFVAARTALTGAAQHLFENGLTLPSGSALTEPQVRKVVDTIIEFVEGRGPGGR